MSPKKSLPSTIGSILAIIQSAFDDLFAFIFKRVRDAGKVERKPSGDPDSIKERAIDAAQKSAEFFGEMGESFYEKYEDIKSRKRAKGRKGKRERS
ncbi:hypothetical protein COV82_05280 [Candidatus Peregrinibacteria bacterium CG11_big_fil_rev_8_21_14_0_20_46_8]|nr:MAG: hypothetical protein COV82_05280 [Candidatus Peregrinibacteria bacterium CG11_big_fil_rev_8_21_14_0_20_46_8]